MMGGEAPETRWATHKRQVINLWNYCILLVDLFESYDDARTGERQIRYECCVSIIASFPILSVDVQGAVCVTRLVHDCLRPSHNAGQQCPCLSTTVCGHHITLASSVHVCPWPSTCIIEGRSSVVFICVLVVTRRYSFLSRNVQDDLEPSVGYNIGVKKDGVIRGLTRLTASKYFVVFSRQKTSGSKFQRSFEDLTL